jgi:TolA-binding protein
MSGTSHGSVRIVKLLLICAGTIPLQNEARSFAGLGAIGAVAGVQGPAERALQAPPNVELDGEILSAPELFRLGRFAEAEPQFSWIAAVRRGTTWGERAQYHLAECQYQQKRYVAALSSFERLHIDYPATGYLDDVVRREFEIAQLWITQLDQQTPADVKLPWFARLDGRLPVFRTRKFALEALEHVRQNDPGGPLADDAAVTIADYYMKRNEFDTAAQYYAQVVADYPKSPLHLYARRAGFQARIRSLFDF